MIDVVGSFLLKLKILATSSNRLIVWGVILEIVLILLIDYNYWGNSILGTAPIHGKVWLFILPFAVGLLILEEFRKWFVRVQLFNRVARRKSGASG